MSQTVITIHQLTTGYRSKRSEHIVSRHVSLEARRGELAMLMGPNGSGKSTLMQTISGLIRPLEGQVLVAGQPIGLIKERDRAHLMSLVLTDKVEHPHLTVSDVVKMGRYPYLSQRGKLHTQDLEILRYCLNICRLGDMEQRYFAELSDGEKQRVMIARALCQETPLMLLDEPTAHLDLPSRLEVLTMLRQLARDLDKSILVSTHELDLALQWADGIWLFDKQGRICSGAPEDLILSGDIERVFGNERLRFDASTGEFCLITEPHGLVHLSAEGLAYTWGARALQRMGYALAHEPSETHPTIEVCPEGWRVRYHDVAHLAPNISELQRIL